MTARSYLLTLAVLSLILPSLTLAWSGTAITGPDNGMLTVARDSEHITLHLYGIKPPETGQTRTPQTKKAITSLVKGRQVTVNQVTTNADGRPAALVYISGQNLNKYLIQEGYALVDTTNCQKSFCNTWVSIEAFARLQGRGMWGEKK